MTHELETAVEVIHILGLPLPWSVGVSSGIIVCGRIGWEAGGAEKNGPPPD
jgi:hypothetical protein